jgi:D-lactate dehydrogenase
MRIAFFDSHPFEKEHFDRANVSGLHEILYLETRLNAQTAALASGVQAVCCFANDKLDNETLCALHALKVQLVALRSAGFNHVDLASAQRLGIPVVRVPAYSPYAVAEHAVALMLCLDRKIHRAYQRVREGNFSLSGLVGFDLHSKTVGIIGTGRIGSVLAKILAGFGCQILAHDRFPDEKLTERFAVRYVTLPELYAQSDILSLHVPLTPTSRHLLDADAFNQMKAGVMVINTGRGALIDSHALIAALKVGRVGYAGLDVYEEEEAVFFEDHSDQVLQDDQLARLLTFPNVLITSHQGFLTEEALTNIAWTTLQNVSDFEAGKPLVNQVNANGCGAS